ncbi:tetratricopeptide repeat protein, partial [Clostridium botulinum]
MDNNLLQYQKKFKENISLLIESNNLQEAKNLIKEYENIINNDIEIYSFKSVISIMENKLDYALEILEKGILMDSNNFDLLYNKAYIEEMLENYKIAYK